MAQVLIKLGCALFLFFVVTGCATPYQSQGFRGGFDETRLQPNVFRVSFVGNAQTSAQTASDYALLRAAELALENGFTHFVVTDSQNQSQSGVFTTPGSSTSTVHAHKMGGQTTGMVNTHHTPGQSILFSKPRSSIIVYMGSQRDFMDPTQVFDAGFVVNSLKSKHGID